MLKRILIENYRSCLRTSIDLHPNLSVLIGPNSSGKTNILQAIMLLSKMAQAEEHRGARRGVISVSSRLKAKFEERRWVAQLNASVAAYPDESNNDVMLAARQKWTLKALKRKPTAFEFPLGILTRGAKRHMDAGVAIEYENGDTILAS